MSLIRLNDVSMEFDGRPVLREAFLKLRRGDRIGLIGKNGTGKTTFLELVLGRREPSGGTVDVSLGTTIGYFSQFSELDGEQSTSETLSAHFAAVHETQARLDEIGAQLAEPMTDAAMTTLLAEQGELFERMDHVGGWTYENTIDTVLTSLGFDEERRHLPVDRLSGGWRNRAALGGVLRRRADG